MFAGVDAHAHPDPDSHAHANSLAGAELHGGDDSGVCGGGGDDFGYG